MYTSPISLLISDTALKLQQKVDETIFQAAKSVAPMVDKEELIRALAYDRDQYEKGYHDGVIDSRKHGRWVGFPECLKYPNAYADDHIVCSSCEECFSVLDNCTERFDYCPHCGARMDLEDTE